ncbi:MAG: oligosaccharide flippase family protein [Alphaproteobacteria bacterium]|nr:oligosaccharide flippase family protein [Alphaproteobacteria bacterium]
MTAAPPSDDIAKLAKGGRTSFFGFLLRLAARLPFLFIAGQLYGADRLGEFAYATMVIELAAQLATLGLKRGLAAELAKGDRPQAHVVWDALVLAWLLAALAAGILAAFPTLMFPKGLSASGLDQLLPLIALAIVGSDVSLAALAYRHDIAAQVRARSIVEPWTLTLVAAALAFTFFVNDGLLLAFAASLVAAFVVSLVPCVRAFGWPRGWAPHPERLGRLARQNIPLAGADAIEWGTRRLDLFILGLFAGPAIVGVYYVAQQVASLVQKLKTSFDPVLAPVLTTALARGDRAAVAAHIRQVGFWVIAAQLGVALTLGLTGEAVLDLVGKDFTGGALLLGIMLGAEVIFATAAVSEAALVYMSRHRNLMLSLATIGVQAAVTVVLAQRFGGEGAAAGLAIAALVGSASKAWLLGRLLGEPVVGVRWPLLLAAAAAIAVGLLLWNLPTWPRMLLGIPLILGAYGVVMWRWGFTADDRVLFRMRKGA